MKRDSFVHFSFWISFFIFVSIIKHYFNLDSWPFWVGGIVGTILPDIDHLIYVMFLSPQELTSQRVGFLWNRKEYKRMIQLLYETRSERKNLIFHSLFFQLIFFALTFFIMTSSVSVFAKGLVLSFALHLSTDQIIDLTELKNLDNWKAYLPFDLDFRKSEIYVVASTLFVCAFGFLM
jgi:hypothetical protein